jgi:hypothetical protein
MSGIEGAGMKPPGGTLAYPPRLGEAAMPNAMLGEAGMPGMPPIPGAAFPNTGLKPGCWLGIEGAPYML